MKAEGYDPRDHVLDHVFEKKRYGEGAFHPTENYNGTVGAVRNHEIEKARWRPGTLRYLFLKTSNLNFVVKLALKIKFYVLQRENQTR